jgi:membrane protein DedA with SNARE-associated domain
VALALLWVWTMSFDFLASLVLAHGYLVVFVAVALDCAALPIPGELLLLTIGGLAVQGRLDPVWAISVATAGVIIADSISYWMGRLGGRRVITRLAFGRHWTPGITTLVFGRFIIGARVLVAPMAGARRLPYGRFVLCDALGGAMWAMAYVLIGYGAGANLAALQRQWASATTAGQIGLAVVIAGFVTIKCVRSRWLRVGVGAALLALFSLRATMMMTEELEPVTVPIRLNG